MSIAASDEHHVEKVRSVSEPGLRIHVRLAYCFLVRYCCDGRHLGDHLDRRKSTNLLSQMVSLPLSALLLKQPG